MSKEPTKSPTENRSAQKPQTTILALKRPSPPAEKAAPPSEEEIVKQPESQANSDPIEIPESESEPDQQQQPIKIDKPKKLRESQELIESATNSQGEQFHVSERIQVTPPWGGVAIAEITGFYRGSEIWAEFRPLESREGWNWEGGVCRVELLKKAD